MGKCRNTDPCIWFICKVQSRPHANEFCDRAYKRRKYLVRHKRECHPPSQPDKDESMETQQKNQEGDDQAKDSVNSPEDETNLVINLSTKKHFQKGPRSLTRTKKSITCEFCGKILSSKGSLLVHSRLHTGVKPYSCVYCQKTFTLKGNCRVHERIHTGERPFLCLVNNCNKSFTQGSQLKCHIQNVHGSQVNQNSEELPVVKSVKNQKSDQDDSHESPLTVVESACEPEPEPLELSIIKEDRPEPEPEPEPEEEVTDNDEVPLINAMQAAAAVVTVVNGRPATSPSPPRENEKTNFCRKSRKLHVCRFCHKQLSQQQALKVHERIHTGERPFVCAYSFCQKSFNQLSALKTHERIHTGEKPYTCRFCPKKFAATSTRQCHEKKHN